MVGRRRMKGFFNRGNVTYETVVVLISILSFFVVFSNFVDLGNNITPKANDIACRAYLNSKDSALGDVVSMLNMIDLKCKKDEITISTKKGKNEVFKTIAEESKRCWYRYGSGEYDFMQSYGKAGNWCFKCGEIDFKDGNVKPYEFNDFVSWINSNDFRYSNGTRVKYSQTFNMKYTDVSDEELKEIKNDIDDLIRNGEDAENYKGFYLIFNSQYNYLRDLKMKKIDSSYKTFVVYRYDKLADEDPINTAMTSAGIAVGTRVGVSIFADSIIWGVGTAVVCGAGGVMTIASGGLAAPISAALCGSMTSGTIIKTAKNLVSGVEKGIGAGSKVYDLSIKISKFMKSTEKLEELKKLNKLKMAMEIGKTGAIVGGGITIGDNIQFDSNQYIDIMSEEEYYRLCGP